MLSFFFKDKIAINEEMKTIIKEKFQCIQRTLYYTYGWLLEPEYIICLRSLLQVVRVQIFSINYNIQIWKLIPLYRRSIIIGI